MRIGFEIKKLNMLISGQLRQATSINELNEVTNTHGYVLKYLAQRENEEVFQRDIEKEFAISRPTVSEIINAMEKNGMVERKAVERDARLKQIIITEKGKALNALVRQEFDAFEERLSGLITPEEEQALEEIIRKLSDGLKKDKTEVL